MESCEPIQSNRRLRDLQFVYDEHLENSDRKSLFLQPPSEITSPNYSRAVSPEVHRNKYIRGIINKRIRS